MSKKDTLCPQVLHQQGKAESTERALNELQQQQRAGDAAVSLCLIFRTLIITAMHLVERRASAMQIELISSVSHMCVSDIGGWLQRC